MMNKRYLDKVIGSLVRSTRINYDNDIIQFPFSSPLPLYLPQVSSLSPYSYFNPPYSDYCKNMFGLIDDEIRYVWKIYKDIIKNKINNGEQ